MSEGIEIRGGASEFHAAVIAVVIDQIEREKRELAQRDAGQSPTIPAWVRALRVDEATDHPLDLSDRAW